MGGRTRTLQRPLFSFPTEQVFSRPGGQAST